MVFQFNSLSDHFSHQVSHSLTIVVFSLACILLVIKRFSAFEILFYNLRHLTQALVEGTLK